MCLAKNHPQWCRITPCEKCPFYNTRTIDNKTIDVSFVTQSLNTIEYIQNDNEEQKD